MHIGIVSHAGSTGVPGAVATSLAITATIALQAVLVRPARGSETVFDSHASYAIKEQAKFFRLFDLTGDGRCEIVFGATDGHVAVMLGDARAGFLTPAFFDRYRRDWDDADAADVDEDGSIDVLGTADGLFLLGGDGAGGLSDAIQIPGPAFSRVRVADVNEDGHVDVACSNAVQAVQLALGNGSGGFGPFMRVDVGDGIRRFEAADFDGDGHVDFGVYGSTKMHILLGDGTGGLSAFDSEPHEPGTQSAFFLDAESDGDVDAIAIQGSSVEFFLNDGTGCLDERKVVPFPPSDRAVAAGDFNGDGVVDLALPRSRFGEFACVQALLSTKDGGYREGATFETCRLPNETFAADVDGDGHVDFGSLVVVFTEGWIQVHRGDGAGNFRTVPPVVPLPIPEVRSYSHEVVVADFDGDGHHDIVSSDEAWTLRTLLGNGAGGFGEPLESPGPACIANLETADFNGDGVPDLVGVNSNVSIATRLGDGAGGFLPPRSFNIVEDPYAIAPGDFDGDGAVDVAVAKLTGVHNVFFFRGDGNGGLVLTVGLGGITSPQDVAAMDADGDGDLDVVVPHSPSLLSTFANDGAGSFTLSRSLGMGSAVSRIVSSDVDEDGRPDVVACSNAGGWVASLLDDGTGRLDPTAQVAAVAPRDPVLADFDGDGHLDVAVTHHTRAAVSLLVGDGAGGLAYVYGLGVFAGGRFAAADFDEDGGADLAIPAPGGIALLVNRSLGPVHDVLAGNVNAAAGAVANVLLVNGSRGRGVGRLLRVDRDALFQIRMKLPPSQEVSARFALFATVGSPNNSTLFDLPFGFGTLCFDPARAKKTWNNTGDPLFGEPDLPSVPAQSTVLRRERGIRKRIKFSLQGVIEDPASPSGVYAVTNGIVIASE